MNKRMQRVLLTCVASNVLFGGAGLALLEHGTATTVATASGRPQGRATAAIAGPTTTVATATTGAAPTTAPAVTHQATSSSVGGHKTTRTTSPAAAAGGDTTGIASSPAPSSSARVSPDLGSYGVDIAGSASVGGRAQRVPTSGSVNFKSSGANVRQTSPDAPGDVVLLQRFTGDKSALVSLELTAGDTHKTFTPSSNATYLLYNSPSGTSWSWSATSTDGKTHVNASGHIGGSRDYNVGGIVVRTVEVVTNLQISGDITGSAELTTWASPEYRLPIVQHQHIDASTRGLLGLSVRLLSDTTTTLRSVTPN